MITFVYFFFRELWTQGILWVPTFWPHFRLGTYCPFPYGPRCLSRRPVFFRGRIKRPIRFPIIVSPFLGEPFKPFCLTRFPCPARVNGPIPRQSLETPAVYPGLMATNMNDRCPFYVLVPFFWECRSSNFVRILGPSAPSQATPLNSRATGTSSYFGPMPSLVQSFFSRDQVRD